MLIFVRNKAESFVIISWCTLISIISSFSVTIYISAANMFNELGMYQLKLPNALNFSITLSTVLRVQAVVLLGGE